MKIPNTWKILLIRLWLNMSLNTAESNDQALNETNVAQKRKQNKEALQEYFIKEKFRKDIIEDLNETTNEIQDEETYVEKVVMVNTEAKNLTQLNEDEDFTDEQYELLVNYKIAEEELMIDLS